MLQPQTHEIVFAVACTTLIILGLLISIIIVVLFAKNQQTKQALLLGEAKLKYQEEIRTIEAEVQETTLNQISSELHDNIGQMLTLMNLQIEKGKITRPDSLSEFNILGETLQNTIQQVRQLSHSLNSEHITASPLEKTIENELRRLLNLVPTKIHFLTDDVKSQLNRDERLVAFRIFQELLNNAIKHASAQNIFVEINTLNGFQLLVRDDGVGFNEELVGNKSTGMGLKNMLKRAKMADMEFSIKSLENNGSTFMLTKEVNYIVGDKSRGISPQK